MNKPSTHVLLENVDGNISVTVGIGASGLQKLQEKFEGCIREYSSEKSEEEILIEIASGKEEWTWTDIESGSGPYDLIIVPVPDEDVLK